jgi:hypothetical protein
VVRSHQRPPLSGPALARNWHALSARSAARLPDRSPRSHPLHRTAAPACPAYESLWSGSNRAVDPPGNSCRCLRGIRPLPRHRMPDAIRRNPLVELGIGPQLTPAVLIDSRRRPFQATRFRSVFEVIAKMILADESSPPDLGFLEVAAVGRARCCPWTAHDAEQLEAEQASADYCPGRSCPLSRLRPGLGLIRARTSR